MGIYPKLVLMAVFWGGTFIAGRVIAQDVPPFSAAFARFVVASVVLLAVVLHKHRTLPPLRSRMIMPVVLLGLTGVFAYNALFLGGLKTVLAGRAALIVALNPVLVTFFSYIFFQERLDWLKSLGMVMCLAGAVLVITRGQISQLWQGGLGWGELFIFGCVLSWTAYSLIGKVVLANLSPLIAVTYSCVIGTAALFFPALAEGMAGSFHTYPQSSWLGIIYLGLFGTVFAFIWYYQGIKILGPSRTSLFINLVPVSAVFMAFVILKEPLEVSLLMGTILVTIGLFLTNRSLSPAEAK